MNPGSAFPGVLIQLRSADGAPGRCAGVEMPCVEGSALCSDQTHWQSKEGHKIWTGIQPYPVSECCLQASHLPVEIDELYVGGEYKMK